MEIHTLKPTNKNKKKKRVGRGGKRGTYSGKGQKGQRSRAGRKIRPAERDVISKFPKLRGSGNKLKNSEKTFEIKFKDLGKYADENGNVSKNILLKKGLIKRLSSPVKILANGECEGVFSVEGISISSGAKKKLEEKGGSVK